MRREEREHRPRREKMPRYGVDIVNLTLTIITTLHDLSLNDPGPTRRRRALKI